MLNIATLNWMAKNQFHIIYKCQWHPFLSKICIRTIYIVFIIPVFIYIYITTLYITKVHAVSLLLECQGESWHCWSWCLCVSLLEHVIASHFQTLHTSQFLPTCFYQQVSYSTSQLCDTVLQSSNLKYKETEVHNHQISTLGSQNRPRALR